MLAVASACPWKQSKPNTLTQIKFSLLSSQRTADRDLHPCRPAESFTEALKFSRNDVVDLP